MEQIYLGVIILMLMVYIFGDKLIPQIIIIFLTLGIMTNEITTTTDLKSSIGILLIYSGVILYAALMATMKKEEL